MLKVPFVDGFAVAWLLIFGVLFERGAVDGFAIAWLLIFGVLFERGALCF